LGYTGTVVTGATGLNASITGSTGYTGPQGNSNPSSLGITYGGLTGGLSATVIVSFTSPGNVNYPVIGSYVVGPYVSNPGGNSPTLLEANTTYLLTATLIGAFSSTFVTLLQSALAVVVSLSATIPGGNPQLIGSENVLLPRNNGQNTYSVNLRLTATYTTGTVLPVTVSFNMSVQCSGLTPASGEFAVAPATLTIMPLS
jgi:hypothetical protein